MKERNDGIISYCAGTDCVCRECVNGRLVTRLSDKLVAMALRQIDLEAGFAEAIERIDRLSYDGSEGELLYRLRLVLRGAK